MSNTAQPFALACALAGALAQRERLAALEPDWAALVAAARARAEEAQAALCDVETSRRDRDWVWRFDAAAEAAFLAGVLFRRLANEAGESTTFDAPLGAGGSI